jgi:alkyl hydroperoxide reductase subunit AhpC
VSAVADKHPRFRELGVEVIVLSVDSVFVHKVWNDSELSRMVEGGAPFPMACDVAGSVGRVYGVFSEDVGIDERGSFIIDPEGVVSGYEVLTAPVGRNVDELIRLFQAFQHVRTHKKEFTPAGWVPGTETLHASMQLVGRVWEVWKPGGAKG